MKNKVCGIISAISFFMMAGTIGGMKHGNISVGGGFLGALFWLALMFITGKVGGFIK